MEFSIAIKLEALDYDLIYTGIHRSRSVLSAYCFSLLFLSAWIGMPRTGSLPFSTLFLYSTPSAGINNRRGVCSSNEVSIVQILRYQGYWSLRCCVAPNLNLYIRRYVLCEIFGICRDILNTYIHLKDTTFKSLST